jgi:hypothetical protein
LSEGEWLEITGIDCLCFVPPDISSFNSVLGRDGRRRRKGTYEISKTLGLIAMNQGVEKARGREARRVEGVEG